MLTFSEISTIFATPRSRFAVSVGSTSVFSWKTNAESSASYAEEAFDKSLPENEQFAFLPKPFALSALVEKVKETMTAQ